MSKRNGPVESEAINLGYEFTGTTGSGHKRWKHQETGAVVITSSTPSDKKGQKNAIGDLRRGARVEERTRREKMQKKSEVDQRIDEAVAAGPKTVRSAVIRALKAARAPVRTRRLIPIIQEIGGLGVSRKSAVQSLANRTLNKLISDQDLPIFRLHRGLYVYDPELAGASSDQLSEAGEINELLWGERADAAIRSAFVQKISRGWSAPSPPAAKDGAAEEAAAPEPPPASGICQGEEVYQEIGIALSGNTMVRSTKGEIFELVPLGRAGG